MSSSLIYSILLVLVLISSPRVKGSTAPLPDMTEVRGLYPDLDDADFQKKIEGATSPFYFFRTLVPLYYLFLHRTPPPELASVWDQSGWCVGDAHPENFGLILNDSGDPLFTINDLDDGGPCPLVADALRFFVAVRLYDPNIDLQPLFAEYLNSVGGGSFKLSKELRDMAKKAEGEIDPNHRWLRDDSHLKRSVGDEVSAAEWNMLQTTLTKEYGTSTKLLDAVLFRKDSGGSGGMLRYRTLLALPQRQIVEFKQIQAPGISPLARGIIPDPAERISRSLKLEQGPFASDLFRVTQVNGREMYLRPRRQGNIGIDLSSLKNGDIPSILSDEAKTLGRLHIRAADDIHAYQSKIIGISATSWISVVNDLAEKTKLLFEQSRDSLLETSRQ